MLQPQQAGSVSNSRQEKDNVKAADNFWDLNSYKR